MVVDITDQHSRPFEQMEGHLVSVSYGRLFELLLTYLTPSVCRGDTASKVIYRSRSTVIRRNSGFCG